MVNNTVTTDLSLLLIDSILFANYPTGNRNKRFIVWIIWMHLLFWSLNFLQFYKVLNVLNSPLNIMNKRCHFLTSSILKPSLIISICHDRVNIVMKIRKYVMIASCKHQNTFCQENWDCAAQRLVNFKWTQNILNSL